MRLFSFHVMIERENIYMNVIRIKRDSNKVALEKLFRCVFDQKLLKI